MNPMMSLHRMAAERASVITETYARIIAADGRDLETSCTYKPSACCSCIVVVRTHRDKTPFSMFAYHDHCLTQLKAIMPLTTTFLQRRRLIIAFRSDISPMTDNCLICWPQLLLGYKQLHSCCYNCRQAHKKEESIILTKITLIGQMCPVSDIARVISLWTIAVQ
jgi:hypothetical protein